MEKTKGELLKEQLFMNRKDATDLLSEEEMQKITDEFIKKIDEVAAAKTKEIMEI